MELRRAARAGRRSCSTETSGRGKLIPEHLGLEALARRRVDAVPRDRRDRQVGARRAHAEEHLVRQAGLVGDRCAGQALDLASFDPPGTVAAHALAAWNGAARCRRAGRHRARFGVGTIECKVAAGNGHAMGHGFNGGERLLRCARQQRDGSQQGRAVGDALAGDIHRTAVAHAGQEHIGADAERAGRVRRQQLDRDVALVVQHRHVEITPALCQQHVGSVGPSTARPSVCGARCTAGSMICWHLRRPNSVTFGGMRVDASTPISGAGTPSTAQGPRTCTRSRCHQLGRQPAERCARSRAGSHARSAARRRPASGTPNPPATVQTRATSDG